MASEITSDGAVALDIQPLIDIMNEGDPSSSNKPRIKRVVRILHDTKTNSSCFNPVVVSLGPGHHGKKHLKIMEGYKRVAARWFISLTAAAKQQQQANDSSTKEEVEKANPIVIVEKVYKDFLKKVPKESIRDDYDGKLLPKENEEKDFMLMMFMDGCFILHFIYLHRPGSNANSTSYPYQAQILTDMFVLENQIPYTVLKALMDLLPNECLPENLITEFITNRFLPQRDTHVGVIWFIVGLFYLLLVLPFLICFPGLLDLNSPDTPLGDQDKPDQEDTPYSHLLHLLQFKLCGKQIFEKKKLCRKHDSDGPSSSDCPYFYLPIKELKALGIKVRRSQSMLLKDVKFKKGRFINSYLELPPITIDASTKTLMLNLVAYEMCPDAPSDRPVSSYVCFMDSLIYDADDVKELRSQNIVISRLGSDHEVVKLFEELATNLSPNYNTYSNVMSGMKQHKGRIFNDSRVWIGQLILTHFTSPWTAISLFAAIFVIALTVVQTIYTIN